MSWPSCALVGLVCVCFTVLVLTAGLDVDNAVMTIMGVVGGAGIKGAAE